MAGKERGLSRVDGDGVRLDREWLRSSGLDGEECLVVDHTDGGLLLLPARPDAKRLYLEPTNRCNLACAACMRHSWDDAPGDMSDEVFAAIVAQLPSLPRLETAHLAGFGEPLTHPRIFEMLHALRAHGLRTELTTNALLLDDERVRLAMEVRVHAIVVSVDGASAKTQADARDGCDLDLVFANIRRLVGEKKARGAMLPWVGLEFVATRRNHGEFQALIEKATELKLDFLFASNVLPYTEEMAGEILYHEDPVALSISPWQTFRWSGFSGTVLPQTRLHTERYCRFVERDALVVAWDGAVSPCYGLMHGHT
ncbi:MAG: radical SAM protein, partial [Chloroflexota bacterium]